MTTAQSIFLKSHDPKMSVMRVTRRPVLQLNLRKKLCLKLGLDYFRKQSIYYIQMAIDDVVHASLCCTGSLIFSAVIGFDTLQATASLVDISIS